MRGRLHTAGEIVDIDCRVDWIWSLLVEAAAGGMTAPVDSVAPTVQLVVESSRQRFDDGGSVRVTRGARLGPTGLIFADACASGFSLRIKPCADQLLVIARYRPDAKIRAAATLLRSRFHLIARSVLVQYPALWWAGVHGRAPLHVSALTSDAGPILLAGPGGVGKSTLVAREISAGSVAACDNLAVSDGVDVFGVAEPIRTTTGRPGAGRRVAHGRREAPWPGERPLSLRPERIAVVQLRDVAQTSCEPIPDDVASRSLITGTLMAGELRRYWAFGATLAAASGLGPALPAVEGVARRLAAALPCHLLTLAHTSAATAKRGPETPTPSLGKLFAPELDGHGR
ncbi:MAG TPA: hypothetical protein VN738_07455 [Acidothermaceae bacterium]|nr:hypothetical protein [Acidothermaceae bacterium]